MTPSQISLVQRSFDEISRSHATFARAFYLRLFQLDPNLQSLLQADAAAHGRHLMAILALAVRSLAQPDALAPLLRPLAERSGGFGLRRYDLDTFAQALADCLSERLGVLRDPQLMQAWSAAILVVVHQMRRAATRDSDNMSKAVLDLTL